MVVLCAASIEVYVQKVAMGFLSHLAEMDGRINLWEGSA